MPIQPGSGLTLVVKRNSGSRTDRLIHRRHLLLLKIQARHRRLRDQAAIKSTSARARVRTISDRSIRRLRIQRRVPTISVRKDSTQDTCMDQTEWAVTTFRHRVSFLNRLPHQSSIQTNRGKSPKKTSSMTVFPVPKSAKKR